MEPLHPVETPPDVDSFEEWDLGPETMQAIAGMGIHKPTPIQALAIGPVLEGRDVIAKAETGTGKTLAFGAPMMSRIDPARASVLGLVMCPTRELTDQVFNVLVELGKPRGITVALIVGGEPMGPQVRALQSGAQVVVGTPGRLLDLMQQGFLSFPWTEFAVLDEADKMLEIGFIDDVKKILTATGEERQTLLFSATFPPALLQLARDYTRHPVEIATASGVATVDTIDQYFLPVDEDRARALARLIDSSEPDDVFLVFCDRRTDVDRLLRRMERERFSVKALHGGYDQASRFRVMTAFRTGDVKALVATDVASRGLDVQHVTHVVNFGVPRDVSDYTHRIGRTGRAGRKGTAITLVGARDERDWGSLMRQMPWDIAKLSTTRTPRGPAGGGEKERGERERGRSRGRDDSGREGRPRTEREEARRDRPARRSQGQRSGEGGARRGERKDESGPPPAARRAERERPKPSERGAPEAGGFGAGLEQAPKRPKRKPGRSEPARENARRDGSERPATSAEPDRTDHGGFGAGI